MSCKCSSCCITFKRYLMRLIYAPDVTPLPFGMTVLLFTILLFNAMMTTMVFAYLPQLVKSFGISEVDTATYVGYIASSMFLSQGLFGFCWGYLGDKKGKKLALVAACIGQSMASLAFGFSTTFWYALVTRFLQGAFGVYVTTQVMLFEMCDKTNKPIAMTIALSSYATGLILGPSIGGYMVFLREQFPSLGIEKGSFLDQFKVFLPNLVLSTGYILCALLFLWVSRKRELSECRPTEEEKKRLLDDSTESICDGDVRKTKWRKNKMLALLSNKQCMLGCLIQFVFNFFAIGFNELYPVWADSSPEYYGLGWDASKIGTSLLIPAVVLMFLQPVFLARVSTYIGIKKIFLWALVAQTMLYPLYPSVAEIQNKWMMWTALCTNIVFTRMAVGACFLGSSVIVNTSVPYEHHGSATGLGNAISGLGRLMAPTAFGRLFSWSLGNVKGVKENKNPLGFPFDQYFSFFMMSALTIITALLLIFIKDNHQSETLKKKKVESSSDASV